MPTIPRERWPQELRRSWAMRGVFVGGCVERGDGSSFRHKAHAHISGRYRGWICVRRADRLQDRLLMLHELAHIVTGQGHTKAFRECLVRLGGTLDPTFDAKGRMVLRSYRSNAGEIPNGSNQAD